MNKALMRFIGLVLCVLLVPALVAPAFAETDEIRITSAEDLVKLAENCSLDTWSDGVKVVLMNDISLSDVDFDSIPIFNGSFDGGGHTIYDLSLKSAQSPCGLFLETGKDADIRNLYVSGVVSPRGDDNAVGGLVGRNRGTVTACGFTGTVTGKRQVGGIAGVNEATGLISLCSVSGAVAGLSETGGIAGYNSGALLGCENSAYINTESVDPALRLDSIDTSSILNFIQSITTDNASITSDTGGVCGYSCGFVENCSNSGTVGYVHLGYNVGGVAGHSSGYIDRCRNDGMIYGRRAVGGIVGLAEPYIVTEETQNLLSGLAYRFAALSDSINSAIADAGEYSDELVAELSGLSVTMLPAATALRSLNLEDPESISGFRETLAGCIASASGTLSGITGSLDDNSDVLLSDFEKINNNLSALSGTAVQAMSLLSGAEESDIVSDESASEDGDGLTLGKTHKCENSGAVYGDSNVGGIAGGISLNSEMNGENLLDSSSNSLIKNRYSLHATIQSCVNRGEVTARHECVGGIVGRMDFGLVLHCETFSDVQIEEGDYAGGICGLSYGRISSCCVKASLSGKRYVGGILGNGYSAENKEERSSLVSNCYSLSRILDDPQFAGAISGGSAGEYENNYFVPMGYAGMDKLSIHGKAEPLSFEEFASADGVVDECCSFTLRFVVDDEVVLTVPFQYGDSFDRSVFPKVERRDGSYAVWDVTDLSNLQFDTTVTAEFRMDETVLRSDLQRTDGRAAVYLDGQFQRGDALSLETRPASELDIGLFRGTWKDTIREQLRSIFRDRQPDYSVPVDVAENLTVAFPEDGLSSHTLRYLAEDYKTRNYRFYLETETGWERLHPSLFGSYYLLTVIGSEAHIAVISTIQSWWVVAYIAGALLVLGFLVFLSVRLVRVLRRRNKLSKETPQWKQKLHSWRAEHKKQIVFGTVGAVLAALVLLLILRFSSISTALSSYRLLREFAQQETAIDINIDVHSDARDINLTNQVLRVRQDGRMISCTSQYGIPLYFCGGRVYLENGRSFEVTGTSLDQIAVLDLAREAFRKGEITRSRTEQGLRFEATLDAQEANSLLSLILAGQSAGLLDAENMTAVILEHDGALQELHFTGEGTTESGKSFTISAALKTREIESYPTVPRDVLNAIALSETLSGEPITEDFLALIAAWMKYDGAQTIRADVTARAEAGALSLNGQYDYARTAVENTAIHVLKTRLFTLYFTDSAACTEAGLALSSAQTHTIDTAKLIPLAKDLCLNGEFSCSVSGTVRQYRIALDPDTASELTGALLSDLKALKISYSNCVLTITLENGELTDISLDCAGTIRVVSRDVECSVAVSVSYRDAGDGVEIPQKVVDTLCAES